MLMPTVKGSVVFLGGTMLILSCNCQQNPVSVAKGPFTAPKTTQQTNPPSNEHPKDYLSQLGEEINSLSDQLKPLQLKLGNRKLGCDTDANCYEIERRVSGNCNTTYLSKLIFSDKHTLRAEAESLVRRAEKLELELNSAVRAFEYHAHPSGPACTPGSPFGRIGGGGTTCEKLPDGKFCVGKAIKSHLKARDNQ